jgi:hypothetical protein
MIQSLGNEAEFLPAMVAAAAGTGDTLDGIVIDTAGFENFTFILYLGTITASAVTTAILKQGTLANGSDMAAITGASISIADTDDGKILVIEVIRPVKRYLRLSVTRATANAVINGAIAIKNNCPVVPVVQSSNVVSVTVLAPAA